MTHNHLLIAFVSCLAFAPFAALGAETPIVISPWTGA